MENHAANTPVKAQPISQGWQMQDTRALYDLSLVSPDFGQASTDPKADAAWREQYLAHMEKLCVAIAGHILHVAKTQGLSLPLHSGNVDNRFVNAWRRAASGESLETHDAHIIGDALSRPVGFKLVGIRPRHASDENPSPTVEQIHDFIHETYIAGDFAMHETDFGRECMTSGLSLSLTIKGWKPSLSRFDHDKRQFYPLAEGDITLPSLQHATIPVPTGHLLIADWFRHDAFNTITDKVLEDSPSINSAAGCEERTRRLAAELGIANVYVGNTCPSIQADADGVRIGSLTEEAQMAGDEVGSVCTDLWWATILDKQTLVDVFTRTMPVEQAMQEVETLLAEQASEIVQVSVPPGEYHLYYAGDVETFENQFDHQGVDLGGFDRPMLVLSRTELQPRPTKPTPKP